MQGEPSPRLRVVLDRVRLGADGFLRVPVYCGSETKVRCIAKLHLNRGYKPIGHGRAEVGRGRTMTIRVQVKKAAARRLLVAGGAVRLRLSVTDKVGARASASAIVAVKARTR